MATPATGTVFASLEVTALSATKKGESVNAEASEAKKLYEEWEKEYSPMYFIEYDGLEGKGMEKAKRINPLHVWTAHATCEDEQVTNGFHFYGDPPRCCWSTFGWHVSQKAWGTNPNEEGSIFIDSSTYTWCDKCNPEGENDEGVEECEECEGMGWKTYYYD